MPENELTFWQRLANDVDLLYFYEVSQGPDEFAKLPWYDRWYPTFALLVLVDTIHHHIKGLYCKRYGHDLEDNGYANPDSGAMIMDCKRCGQHWHHQLY